MAAKSRIPKTGLDVVKMLRERPTHRLFVKDLPGAIGSVLHEDPMKPGASLSGVMPRAISALVNRGIIRQERSFASSAYCDTIVYGLSPEWKDGDPRPELPGLIRFTLMFIREHPGGRFLRSTDRRKKAEYVWDENGERKAISIGRLAFKSFRKRKVIRHIGPVQQLAGGAWLHAYEVSPEWLDDA